jgi:hypothetical protein
VTFANLPNLPDALALGIAQTDPESELDNILPSHVYVDPLGSLHALQYVDSSQPYILFFSNLIY